MSACNFIIPFSGDPTNILLKAKTAVQNQAGTFEGNEAGGHFDVSIFGSIIKGTYSVAGNDLNIVIESKPFLIPCSTIENFLKNKIGG